MADYKRHTNEFREPWRIEQGEDFIRIFTVDDAIVAILPADNLAIANLIKSCPKLCAVIRSLMYIVQSGRAICIDGNDPYSARIKEAAYASMGMLPAE